MAQTTTYCRLCEAGCGLVAHTDDDGRLLRLRPDHDHPFTRGFACRKGLLAADVHRDPARVRRPQRRDGDGFAEVEWDAAREEIATRLNEIVDHYGPRAVACYLGNPNAFNALSSAGTMVFAQTLGTDRMFSSVTQDCANKFAVAELLYGAPQANPIPDFEHTELLLVIGSNPRVSRSSFLSVADPVGTMRAIRDRGGRVVFVNPVAIEPGIGETIQIRPDSDPYLLAAMLHEIGQTTGYRLGALEGHVDGVAAVEDFVARYSPDAVAPVVGIGGDVIRRLARDFAAAPSASLHVSTGLNMGRQGALAYWLAQMLLLLTGNLDHRGGNYFAARAFSISGSISGSSSGSSSGSNDRSALGNVPTDETTKWGSYRRAVGMIPAALLADMIEDDDEPIRALFVLAGNPALSMGDGARVQRALSSLDLLVSIDLYRNATGERADFVLPATDQFERADLNTFVQGTQPEPFVQCTDPVATVDGEQREEWRILSEIVAAMGRTPLLDPAWADPLATVYDGALAGAGLTIGSLREAGGVAALDEPGPGRALDQLPIDTIDCVPDALRPALGRAEELFAAACARPDGLRMITRRTPNTMNSALQNVEALHRNGDRSNPLWMHPDDGERRGLVPGATARIANEHGEITAPVRFDPNLRPGVVAMTHGFGNATTAGMPVAQAHPGVNVNLLSPGGPGSFDPLGGMSHLTGIEVEVEAIDAVVAP